MTTSNFNEPSLEDILLSVLDVLLDIIYDG